MMTYDSGINNAAHWHERAKDARAIAETMNNDPAKQLMLRIAKSYDDLATWPEKTLLRPPQSK
jgi:hypothetical protein